MKRGNSRRESVLMLLKMSFDFYQRGALCFIFTFAVCVTRVATKPDLPYDLETLCGDNGRPKCGNLEKWNRNEVDFGRRECGGRWKGKV